jgi:uncharacterized protein (TIGR01777 family)
MRVAIAGASGFIGRALTQALVERTDSVIALTRSASKARSVLPPAVSLVEWSPERPSGQWIRSLAGVDAIVNLAGEPVADKRWTAERKRQILDSRIEATRAVVMAMERAAGGPKTLVNGSAIGFYGSRGDEILTEESAPGFDFLAGVVRQWESTAAQAAGAGIRVVLIRSGIVLGLGGGALPRLLLPFRLFGGGVMGPRDQWVSWIHLDDEIGLILAALDKAEASGPMNATSPNPVTMDAFSHAIGRALHRPVWVPGLSVPMRLALGERSEVAFASQRALPEAARRLGYTFKHSDVDEALGSLIA